MKIFIIVFALLSMASVGQADFYIVNIENEVVAKTEYAPDAGDIESRNEISVFLKENIDLKDAEYRGGKIVRHTETQKEKDAKKEEKDRSDNKEIDKASAKVKLIASGFTEAEADMILK